MLNKFKNNNDNNEENINNASKKMPKIKNLVTLKNLRTRIVNDPNYTHKNQWVLKTPYEIRDSSMSDLLKAYDANIKSLLLLKYKSKKDKQQTITIRSKNWNKPKSAYAEIFNSKLKAEKHKKRNSKYKLPKKLNYDSKLIKTKVGHYFISIPAPLKMKCVNTIPINTISMDPGTRTFITGYDSFRNVYEWSTDITCLRKINNSVNILKSKAAKTNHRERYKLNKIIRKLRLKISNKIKDLHNVHK